MKGWRATSSVGMVLMRLRALALKSIFAKPSSTPTAQKKEEKARVSASRPHPTQQSEQYDIRNRNS